MGLLLHVEKFQSQEVQRYLPIKLYGIVDTQQRHNIMKGIWFPWKLESLCSISFSRPRFSDRKLGPQISISSLLATNTYCLRSSFMT